MLGDGRQAVVSKKAWGTSLAGRQGKTDQDADADAAVRVDCRGEPDVQRADRVQASDT
jgi:hypothetical protein